MTSAEMKANEALVEKYLPKAEVRFENTPGFRVVVDLEDGPALGDLIRELDRFREREPLVQALIKAADDCDIPSSTRSTYAERDAWKRVDAAAMAVRDFKLTEDKL